MPCKSKRKPKSHTHWVSGKSWNTRLKHPVSRKHRNTRSQLRHDATTGKFQRWLKKHKLNLVDRNTDRYIKEVLKK